MKKQFFCDLYGNTASITNAGMFFVLICRNYYGQEWKRGKYATARGAKSALARNGPGWTTTKGYVTD